MSQSDSFIEEVTEEVRRDRLFATFRRYGGIAIIVVVLIVAAAAWNEYRKAQLRAEAEMLGDALLSALEQDTPEGRIAALTAIVPQTPGQEAVQAFLVASESAVSGDAAAAADALNRAAQLSDLPPIYRNLAKFKALGLQAGLLGPEERRDGYRDLAVPGSDLRLLAEEQIALTWVEQGDTDTAKEVLQPILDDAEVTPGLRQRASQLMVALGADPATLGGGAASGE